MNERRHTLIDVPNQPGNVNDMTQQMRERGGEKLAQWQQPNLEGLLQSTLELLGLHVPCLWQCGKVCGNEVANSIDHV
jgi:hypothetical protein